MRIVKIIKVQVKGKHKLYPNQDYFNSMMQICHQPRHVLSDTCIGGQN